MGMEGFDGKEHTTNRGKVVYRRRRHFFDAGSIDRIITNYNNDILTIDARETNTAIKIRSIFKVAGSLYANVDDLFDRPGMISSEEYEDIKETWREFNDEIIDIIADFIGQKSGIHELEYVLSTVGRLINRGMEYLITGSTEF